MITGAILLLAQATAAPSAASTAAPDVEITAHVEAREVTIEQEGPIRVTLTPEAGSSTVVNRSQPAGGRTYRNLTIDARLAAVLTQDDNGTPTVSTTSSTGEQPQ